ncbi:hypothetical protein CBFG_04946 [Clostridiales bacterium 1_7_47FAA]|nr:hypothetical protein CBFG_04946 [Clostridiales bacterium 1_7_47FAA]
MFLHHFLAICPRRNIHKKPGPRLSNFDRPRPGISLFSYGSFFPMEH